VIFKDNLLSNINQQIYLKGAGNSIIADNRFDVVSEQPNIIMGDWNQIGCRNIQIKGNLFRKEKVEDAIRISPNSKVNIDIQDNQFSLK